MEGAELILFCMLDIFFTSFMWFHHSKSVHEPILVQNQHLFNDVSKQYSELI